ncbi:MAG: MFS transporter [Myxococcales bacterium]|jgi:MFS family permease|nr:MFS transporter [Myxococcales bacterium]
MTTALTRAPAADEALPTAANITTANTDLSSQMSEGAPTEPPSDQPSKGGLRSFGRAFFMLNTIEMWERLAYFAVRTVIPIYIMQADDPGGLHLTAADKGTIYGVWFLIQSVLPMFTGGFADRYGYKKTMAVSIALNAIGYVLMAFLRSYAGFFFGICVLATGTAFFKPSIQGSLAQNLNKNNSSMGWGIFYWVVNVGGATGPFVATAILGAPNTAADAIAAWRNLFLASAGFTCLNFLMLFTFRDVPSGASKVETPLQVLKRTFVNIFEPRLVSFLLIMSCFWLMMYQLWDLHPNFIADWVDSSRIAALLPASMSQMTDRGFQVPQQIMLNLNAMLIVVAVIPVSWLVRRLRALESMLMGMVVATGGILVAGLTGNGWILLAGIVFFSAGEMLTGPKKNEYLGLIAPPGKKGLYLGYVNIPVGIGGFVGAKMAGFLYGHYGEKATLSLKYLAAHANAEWDGSLATLEAATGVARKDAFLKLQEVTGLDAVQATQMLWDTYSPHTHVWLPFVVIGVAATIALAIFGQMAKRWKDMNA